MLHTPFLISAILERTFEPRSAGKYPARFSGTDYKPARYTTAFKLPRMAIWNLYFLSGIGQQGIVLPAEDGNRWKIFWSCRPTLQKGSVLPEKSCFCSFLLFLDQSYDMISYKRSKRKAPTELEAKLELANLSHKTLPILTTKLRIF